MYRIFRTRFEDMKLSQKMTFSFSAAVIVFLIVALIALEFSFAVYDKKLYDNSLTELHHLSLEVDNTISSVNQMTKRIALDGSVQRQLANAEQQKWPSEKYSYCIQQIRSTIQYEMLSYPSVKNVMYLDRNRVQLTIGNFCGTLHEGVIRQYLDKCREARGGYIYCLPTEDYPYLLAGRDILEVENVSLDYLGTILATVDIVSIVESMSAGLEAEHSALLILEGDHVIYAPEDVSVDGLPPFPGGGSGYEIVSRDGLRYFQCYLTSELTGWTYINLFPYSDVFRITENVRFTMIVVFLLLTALMMAASRQISETVTRPLKELTESFHLLEQGKLQAAKDSFQPALTQDEVGVLTREYRRMLDQIDHLTDENYEKQLLLQESRYQMLQAQINPHFLYNTLNTLLWTIRAERNEDATKMIVSLGQMLRATFGKETMTTIAEELRTVENYILIQRYRYQKRAEFVVEREGSLEQYKMPNMILQPLVENALLHGVDNTGKFCTVRIRAIEREADILLEVSDTGGGMTQEELTALRNMTIKPKGSGIGVKNIYERMCMTFPDTGFEIESAPGKGTTIRIIIPKRKGDICV